MVSINALSLAAAVLVSATGGETELGADRGSPLLPPAGALVLQPPQTFAVDRGVVFVNFDGATLTDEAEDSRTNSTLIGWSGTFEGYGAGAKRDAVLQAVKTDFEPYDIMITDQRPPAGEYVMAMVGPTNFTAGSLGIAMLDCDDWWTHNNVVYAFHDIDDGYTASGTATTIGQEVAHTFGLEHVDAPSDIMNPYNAGGDPAFTDGCLDLLPADGIGLVCDGQHEAACGPGERQNAHAELLNLFGPNAPDAADPVARISAPEADTVLPTGSTFVIEATVSDDQGIASVVLFGGGEELTRSTKPPWAWQVNEAPAGEYRFAVRAEDYSGNQTTSVEVTVYVEDGAPVPDPADDSGGDVPGGSDSGEPADPASDDDAPSSDDDGSGDPEGATRDSGTVDDPPWLPDWAENDERYSSFEDSGCAAGGWRPKSGYPLVGLAALILLGLRRRQDG